MRGTHYVDICALNLHPPDLLFGTILLFSSFRDRSQDYFDPDYDLIFYIMKVKNVKLAK